MICDMIVKAIRFRTRSSVQRLISHLKNGADNDHVAFITGTSADIADMHRDAQAKGSTYSVRHWIISPHEATTREQAIEVVKMIAGEFDFDPARAVIVEHTKPRATADAHNVHWHVLVGEIDPVTRKALRCSFDRILHELVARWSEYKFGHRFVAGSHTKVVIAGLQKRGAFDAARSVAAHLDGREPSSGEAFTHAQHQAGKRIGTNLPVVRRAVKQATAIATTRAELEASLAAASLLVSAGNKPNTWIVTGLDGEFIGSLARLSGIKNTEIHLMMMGTSDEPASDKSDNRTGNLSRSASHSEPLAAPMRPATTRTRSPHSDTGENPRKPRTGVGSDREGEPEARSKRFEAGHTNAWMKNLNALPEQLSSLLGFANKLALTPAERVVAALWELEQSAQFDASRKIPIFKPSEELECLQGQMKLLETELSRKTTLHISAEIRLRSVKKPRWWHYLIGFAFILESRQRHLATEEQKTASVMNACERDLAVVKSKFIRKELMEKRKHSDLITLVANRKAEAVSDLETVNAANNIIRKQPHMAFCGLEFIIHRARLAVEAARYEKDQDAALVETTKMDLAHSEFSYRLR